jgi:DNA modification methylase
MELIFETWPIDRCVDYARNPRKNDHAVDKVAAAIREFGFRVPIVAKSDGLVVDGHLRLKAAKKLGLTEVPVILADDMSEAQIKAFRLSVNKVAELAEWDDALLGLEIMDLKEMGFDLELTGFELAEIDALFPVEETAGLTDEDAVPEAPEHPVTVEGDVWVLGRHRLMCGDSTSIDAVERLMGGRKADMVFTDPPYGVNMQRSGSIKGDASMDEAEGIIAGAISVASVVSKQGASWYFWVGFRAYAFTDTEVSKHRKVSNCIVWKKPSIGMGKGGYRFQHELCVFAGEVESRSVSDVWEFGRDTSALHPTMKPVDLVCYGLNNSSKSGDEVLDLFGGSGSTLIACEKTARDCRMMELDPKYCDVILQRYIDFVGDSRKVFLSTDDGNIPYEEVLAMRKRETA